MAKILVSFDTIDKTLEVKKDGESLEDVKSVSFYPSYSYDSEGEMCCCITMISEDETTDIKTMTNLMASKNLAEETTNFLSNFLGK